MLPHKLLHTYATNLAEQMGGDIPLIMSHIRAHIIRYFPTVLLILRGNNARKATEMLDKRREK